MYVILCKLLIGLLIWKGRSILYVTNLCASIEKLIFNILTDYKITNDNLHKACA